MEYLNYKDVMNELGISKNAAYKLKDDKGVEKFLNEPLDYKEKPFLSFNKEQIIMLKDYYKESPRVVVTANHKGGATKTSTTANLAQVMAEKGKKVLIIDLDFQANLTSIFEEKDSGFDSANLYSYIDNLLTFTEVIHSTRTKNLDIVPSHEMVGEAELVGFSKDIFSKVLKSIKYYDFIFFDTPPSISRLTNAALEACTDVLIPITPTSFAIDGIKLVKKTITLAKAKNKALNELGVVLTRYVKTQKSSRIITDVLDGKLFHLLNTKISQSTDVENFYYENKTIYEGNRNHKVSLEYEELVKELFDI